MKRRFKYNYTHCNRDNSLYVAIFATRSAFDPSTVTIPSLVPTDASSVSVRPDKALITDVGGNTM